LLPLILIIERVFKKRKAKCGLGFAYKAGFRVVMEMDADFSHDPSGILHVFRKCANGLGVVIGSRYVSGGRVTGWDLQGEW